MKSIFGIISVGEMISVIHGPDYINATTPFIDQPLAKLLAGRRRGGKPTMFGMLKLLKRGADEGNIIQWQQKPVCGWTTTAGIWIKSGVSAG